MHAYHKGQGLVWGWIKDILHDRSVFYMSKVASCIRSLLDLRVFRFGDKFLVLISGIPIGGPISGAILDLVLAKAECHYDLSVLLKSRLTLEPDRPPEEVDHLREIR